MKPKFLSFLFKAIFKTTVCVAILAACLKAIANDGSQPSSVSVKNSVPVNYYQAFMILLAVIYGVYLIVRAKRRKRNSKITGQ